MNTNGSGERAVNREVVSAAAARGPLALEAVSISKDFRLGQGQVLHAVRDVSFALYRGAVVALVGESGSGKSTAARLLAGQERLTSGEIRLDDAPTDPATRRAFRRYKSEVQLVFQDPFSSLNPVHTVRHHLERPVRLHQGKTSAAEMRPEIASLLSQVRLTPPDNFTGKYPHSSPANETTDFDAVEPQQAPLRVLLYGVNPAEYVDMWDDMTKLLHCQKLLWWHDYVAMLQSQGHVTHAWGSNDITASLAPNTKTGGHVAIYRTTDFDEFDSLYRVDPVRSKQLYISIALRPIADQRASDERRYALARTRTLAPLP